MKKILLVLQCYNGDKKMAMSLARLIADIEPGISECADFMLAFRWDTAPDPATEFYLKRRFERVYVFNSTHHATGWPAGCNQLFFDSLHEVARKSSLYDVALFFEADTVPLIPEWIAHLQRKWYECGAPILGHIIPKSQFPVPHVNGNCMISTTIGRAVRSFYGCPGSQPWDIFHAKHLLPLTADPGVIHSNYRQQSITEEQLYSPIDPPFDHPLAGHSYAPIFYHGVKSMDAQDIVRAKLLPTGYMI